MISIKENKSKEGGSYDGKVKRLSVKEFLEEKCSLSGIKDLFHKENLDDIKNEIEELQRQAFIEACPKKVSICWCCRRALNIDKENPCSWSQFLKLRPEWNESCYSIHHINSKKDDLVWVHSCKGFSPDQRLEKKYIVNILHVFFEKIVEEKYKKLFSRKYFFTGGQKTIGFWLELYNDFLSLLDIPSLISITREMEQEDLEEDLEEGEEENEDKIY